MNPFFSLSYHNKPVLKMLVCNSWFQKHNISNFSAVLGKTCTNDESCQLVSNSVCGDQKQCQCDEGYIIENSLCAGKSIT